MILRCQSQRFRTKWTLEVKNCGKIAILERIDLCLVESWSPVGFEHGVFATALSLQKSFNWFLLPIFWWEPQVDAEMHLKQYCRHLSSVDMVLHSFFGDCVL